MCMGRRGIINGLLIGFAEIIGETAPLIFLTSSLQSFATSVTGTPVFIYAFAFGGYPNSNDVARGSLVSITTVTITFVIARKVAK